MKGAHFPPLSFSHTNDIQFPPIYDEMRSISYHKLMSELDSRQSLNRACTFPANVFGHILDGVWALSFTRRVILFAPESCGRPCLMFDRATGHLGRVVGGCGNPLTNKSE